MRYTLLRLTSRGIVLCEYHLRRLRRDEEYNRGAIDRAARTALDRLCRDHGPGVWAITIGDDDQARIEARSASSLHDGMPARFAPSPLRGKRGMVPKPPSPSPYDAVRVEDETTLLTSPDGTEIYEACRAAVLAWDGERVVCVPPDRPRVWSTAEAALREHMPVRECPIAVDSPTPILLVNAIKGTCTVDLPTRLPTPDPVRRSIERLFAQLTEFPTGSAC